MLTADTLNAMLTGRHVGTERGDKFEPSLCLLGEATERRVKVSLERLERDRLELEQNDAEIERLGHEGKRLQKEHDEQSARLLSEIQRNVRDIKALLEK
jgi:hypothetical protein